MGVSTEVIKKRGAFFSYGETRLGQGRENVRELLNGNADLCAAIESDIRTSLIENAGKIGGSSEPVSEEATEAEA